ncbi:MAG: thioesterase family protein [Glaciecola sp.]
MANNQSKPNIPQLHEYAVSFEIDTRWMDNDQYGHVNNVVYYSYFDSIVNRFLIEQKALDVKHSKQIGLMVASQCFYHSSVAFPDKLVGGLKVNKIGNSSVEYGVGIFKAGATHACAHGSMTHVFVDRLSQKPVRISGHLFDTLSSALICPS